MSPRAWLGLALAAVAAPLAAATVPLQVLGAGQVSQPWLALVDDPRSAAMGGATVTDAQGTAALQVNVAGLDTLVDPEIAFSHNEFDSSLGLRLEDLAFGKRVGDGAAAGSLRYLSLGSFEDRDANGASLGSSNDNGYAGTLAYAQSSMGDRLHLGLGLTGSQEVLSGQSDTLFTGALGGIYQPWGGLRLAFSANSVRLGGGAATPSLERLGLGWGNGTRSLQLGGEWDRQDYGDNSLRLGGEWTLAGAYALRAGWRFPQGAGVAQDAGLSLGLGLKLGDFSLDYAFVPNGDFGSTQRLGATLAVGEGLFGSKIVIEAGGTSEAAQAEYRQGMEAFDRKDWTEAKVSLRDVLTLQPAFPKAAELTKLLADLDRKIEAEKAAYKSGGDAKVPQGIARKVKEAHDLYDHQQLVAARKKLDEVFEIDSTLKDAVALQKLVDATIQRRVGALKEEALEALGDGDLETAVGRYREALVLEPNDKEIRDKLGRLRPRIDEEIRRLHREGIDAYVASDLAQAISLWQKALKLDPADPQAVGRDLEKAQKLQQLRAGT